jgi:hypothetical protein
LRKNRPKKREPNKAPNSGAQPEVEKQSDNRQAILDALYGEMPRVKKELLEEAGIQVFKTPVHLDKIDPDKDHVQCRIVLHKKNGEIGTLTINVLGGKPEAFSSEFSHIYPNDPSGKHIEHYSNPKFTVVDSFSKDLLARLETAAKKLGIGEDQPSEKRVEDIGQAVKEAEEGDALSQPEAEVLEEKAVEALPDGFGVGSLFRFSEEFRNNPNFREYCHDLASRLFPEIDENDRLAKLMDSDLVVTQLKPLKDSMYKVGYEAKQNGGQTDLGESLFLTPQEMRRFLII